jgi:hypothetical protein
VTIINFKQLFKPFSSSRFKNTSLAGLKMQSFLKLKGPRSELGHRSSSTRYNESKLESCKQKRARTVSKPAAVPPFKSAALRGLYAQPERKHERSKAHPSKHAQTSRGKGEKKHPDDSVIEYSMYPQIIGRRRSEVEAEHAAALASRRGNVKQNGRPLRRRQASSDIKRKSWETGSSHYSGWDENVEEARPVQINMHPRARYIKQPVKTTAQPSKTPTQSLASENPSAHFNRSQTSLPGDEYRQLKRRQQMQRAREVLELHFAGRHNEQSVPIWHGMKQGFTVRNSERRRISRMQFAVRKARCAGLDILDDKFRSAMQNRADKVYFSEMTDVDGVPIDGHMMYEFIGMYQNVPVSPIQPPRRRTWPDERNKRFVQQAKPARRSAEVVEMVDAGLITKPHNLVSKFSWDDDDSEPKAPNRLQKFQRKTK